MNSRDKRKKAKKNKPEASCKTFPKRPSKKELKKISKKLIEFFSKE